MRRGVSAKNFRGSARTVVPLAGTTLGEAAEAFLARRDLDADTVRSYAQTPWRLLYESAARADEVLALNVEDLDTDNKRGRTIAKGGTVR